MTISRERYIRVMEEITRLMVDDPAPDSKRGKRLQALAELAGEYERHHYKLPEPTPEELAEFRKEQEGGSDGT